MDGAIGAASSLAGGGAVAAVDRATRGMRSCLGRNLLSGAAEGAAENGVSSGLEYLTSGEPVTVGGLARAVGGGALDGALDGASSAALEKATGTARYGCFTPTTPVLMADGTTRPIKDVRPGDRVASRDPATGRLVAATVDRTHTHARVPTIRLTTTSGTVTTTATHPVHVAGRGYVPAGRLRAGDTLTTPDHAPVHVVSVQATGHTTTVHNLTIRHTHNYHVHTTTKQAILVHNNGTNKTPGACDPPEPDEGVAYRVIRPDEDPAVGLTPKNPDANYTITAHVRNGSRLDTQYISATRSLDVAEKWSDKTGNRIVEINLSQVRGSVIDLTTESSRQTYLRNEIARRFANKSKEVVIEGSIPPDAITIIKGE